MRLPLRVAVTLAFAVALLLIISLYRLRNRHDTKDDGNSTNFPSLASPAQNLQDMVARVESLAKNTQTRIDELSRLSKEINALETKYLKNMDSKQTFVSDQFNQDNARQSQKHGGSSHLLDSKESKDQSHKPTVVAAVLVVACNRPSVQ